MASMQKVVNQQVGILFEKVTKNCLIATSGAIRFLKRIEGTHSFTGEEATELRKFLATLRKETKTACKLHKKSKENPKVLYKQHLKAAKTEKEAAKKEKEERKAKKQAGIEAAKSVKKLAKTREKLMRDAYKSTLTSAVTPT